MADLRKAIKKYLKDKFNIHMDEWEQENKPVQDMRKKQGEGMWQGDIGEESSEEEEKRKKKESGK